MYQNNQPLFVLPFDHRSSFQKIIGAADRELTSDEYKLLCDYKKVIYEGFQQGVKLGVPVSAATILVDESFGSEVISDAVRKGFLVAVSTEKSGQKEFDFEYGDEFGAHLNKFKPTFSKVLLRYNPDDEAALNARQREKLKVISDFSKANGYKFLIEPLIPATDAQMESVGGDKERYDQEIRPELAVRMIKEIQDGGADPDIWKIEGFTETAHYADVVAQARVGGRTQAAIIVLGRGADAAQVDLWLRAGAVLDGVVGFAVGRTVFWEALVAMRDKKMSREEAAKQMGEHYYRFYKVFTEAKG
ncbi:MAG: DUF2090 domain-containing protein [Patescibacteria group bacterium]|jgi:myo-inositol catabolism protein IolC